MKKTNELQGKFDSGEVSLEMEVTEKCRTDVIFMGFVMYAVNRFLFGDWGDLPSEERSENDRALSLGRRIFGFYHSDLLGEDLWIMLDRKKNCTTVFCQEKLVPSVVRCR